MSISRRVFLKGTAIAGAGAAFDGLPGLALSPEVRQSHAASIHTVNEFTRGLGIYPGDPGEDFSPELVIDNVSYRNLALLRPAYHSSSYDYNLTAQLITDGIKDTRLPEWVATTAGVRGALPKTEREFVFDHSRTNSVELTGAQATVQIHLGGGSTLPEVDRVDTVVVCPIPNLSDLSFTVSVSDEGRNWEQVGGVRSPQPASPQGYPRGFARPGELFVASIALSRACRNRFYQVEFAISNAPPEASYTRWKVGEVAFFRENRRVQIGGPYSFTSAWMSAGPGEEWVYVDLGARCSFDRVKLYWIARAAQVAIQVSDDAKRWRSVHHFNNESGLVDDVKLLRPAHGRYVRVLMERATSPEGYILSEMEVYGRGGPVARHKHRSLGPSAEPAERFNLGASSWRLQRDSLVEGTGRDLSKAGFADDNWVIATVPGTVLTSYLNIGAIPDPNIGQNQLYVSDSYFYSDFWYRTEFTPPPVSAEKRVWLNFDGINWKADVFLNGDELGRIEGAFTRGKFDATRSLVSGQKNALAVRIEKNATPGSCKQKTFESMPPNGGALGADNPTYHASVGWDWMPTIRGRNTGIVGGVYLTATGVVTIESPHVGTSLPLPDTSSAEVSIEMELLNHATEPTDGILRGRLGDVQFQHPVRLQAAGQGPSRTRVQLNPSTHPQLRLHNPKLWWPVGYGDAYLYDFELTLETSDGNKSDRKTLKVGLRQVTYNEEGGALRLWINGRRFIPRGGNWGFSESMLRYRAREYDAALRYHREMNLNMIRNWVGQVGDSEFYDACDRYGVMVWQDFWLANPWDGPDPDDNTLFLRCATDTVLRIRHHASLALYCGRNEGFPPKELDDGLRALVSELHPDLHYISNSAEGVVGGGGPYALMPLPYYSTEAAFPKLHSEIGIPTIPSIESMRTMLSANALWPPGLEWGMHDLVEGGVPRGPTFLNIVEATYGSTNKFEEWIWLANLAVYEGFRAEFEAQSKNRMGLLVWMSHSAWPSLLWQTYDYYLEPTPAYFACKKVCEPLHIQWNRVTDDVDIANYSAGEIRGLTALAEILNIDGSIKWRNSVSVDSKEDTTVTCMRIEYPAGLTAVHFVRLTLSRGPIPVSTNLYMRSAQEANYRAIRELTKAQVTASSETVRNGQRWLITTRLHNTSAIPAFMVRLKVVRQKSRDRILPVTYSENYITVLPGEQRMITAEVDHADTRAEQPEIELSGFNLQAREA